MTERMSGRVVLVTGGASGIGRGAVELIVSQGGKVVVADVQDDAGRRIEDENSGCVEYVNCDVTDESRIKHAVATCIETFGRLDGLFNNAGTPGAKDPADGVTAEGFDGVMSLHVRAALLGIKYAVPHMRVAGGGAIVTTSSVAGLQGGYGPVLYSIAKAAIVHMTRVAALQLAPESIRVNCVCPGIIATNILTTALGIPDEEAAQRLDEVAHAARHSQPIPRGGLSRDVAEAVVFLLSDASSWVTGQALTVDGGLTLGPSDPLAGFSPILEELGIGPDAITDMVQNPN